MTREDTIKILAVLKGMGVKFEGDTDVIIGIWSDCFKNEEYSQVSNAVKKLMNTEKQLFQNGLIAKIKELLIPDNIFSDSANAWNEVRQAMHDSHPDIISDTQKAWNSLSPIIQKVLGNSHTLIEWEYETSRDILNTVIKSNFMKEYSNLCRIYKDDLKNGGKMLKGLEKPKLEFENKENIKLVENLVKQTSETILKID